MNRPTSDDLKNYIIYLLLNQLVNNKHLVTLILPGGGHSPGVSRRSFFRRLFSTPLLPLVKVAFSGDHARPQTG
jgi:hypothetical protein